MVDITTLIDAALEAENITIGVEPIEQALREIHDDSELIQIQQETISYLFAKVHQLRNEGTILFESSDAFDAAAQVSDLAHDGILLALEIAIASDSLDTINGLLAASSLKHGPAFGIVAARALQFLSTQTLEQIYASSPHLQRFLPQALKAARGSVKPQADDGKL